MDDSKRCPSCGMAYDDDNLIVCLGCGAELHAMTSNDKKKYNLISAYKAMFAKFFDFRSRSSRGEYWWAYLANAIIVVIFLAVPYLKGEYLSKRKPIPVETASPAETGIGGDGNA